METATVEAETEGKTGQPDPGQQPTAPTTPPDEATKRPEQPPAADRAKPEDAKERFELRALEALDEGRTVAEARKVALEAEPGPSDGQAAKQAESGAAERTAAGKTGDDAGTRAATPKEGSEPSYDGLDAKGKQALSQTQLLPDPAVWKDLSLQQRTNLLVAARELVSRRTREYQQELQQRPRDERGRFAPAATAADENQPERVEPATGADSTQRQQAADDAARQRQQQPARGDGTPPRDDRTGLAPARARAPELPKQIRDFAEQMGEDVAKPLIEGLTAMQQAHHEEVVRLEQQLAAQQEAQRQTVLTQLRAEEQATWAALADDLPSLATNTEAQERIKAQAAILANAQYQATGTWSWRDCLTQAARSLLHSDIQQEAQRRLAQRRQKSLRATPERGTGQEHNERVLSRDEWDRQALEMLDSGRTVADARAARE